MKTTLITLFFLGMNALAENPAQLYRMADMVETDSTGYVLQTFAAIRNTLSEFKENDRTVSFEFSETVGPPPCTGEVCPLMPSRLKLTVFKQIRSSKTDCGSTKYTGRSEGSRMILLDHSTRLCDDYKPHQWELRILSKKKSVRYFQGDPRIVGDSKCESYTSNAICITLYAPATCSYKEVSAYGGNSCFAIAELKKALCERGIDADHISEDDIVCSSEPVCALPTCAAP